MAEHDPDRQRFEDMLKASEQRRATSEVSDERTAEQRGGEPGGGEQREDRGADGDARPANGERPARATGSAASLLKAGLITGGLSLPGSLLPILGLLLGIAAIVLGVMVGRRSADWRAKLAIGLGALGVVLSIALFVLALASQ